MESVKHSIPDWMKEKTTPPEAAPRTVALSEPQEKTDAPVLQNNTKPRSLAMYIRTKDDNTFEVIFDGAWDGHKIKGVIRAIEKQYKVIKHNMTRKALQDAAKAKLSKQGEGDAIRN